MQLAEFGGFFFVAAGETGLLELQVAELLFVFEMRIEIDQGAAEGGFGFRVSFGEFVSAAGVDGGFETGDALQAPLRIGHGLDEFGFTQADGLVFPLVGGNEFAVGIRVVGGEKDGAAGESGFDGVHGGDALAFRRAGAGRETAGSRDGLGGPVEFAARVVEGFGDGFSDGLVAKNFAGFFFGFALGGAADGTWAHGG